MKKRVIICIFTCILFLTILPIESNLALTKSTKTSGDLYITSVDPIQVIEDADTLVKNKLTVLRVTVESTFPEEISVEFEITYDFGTQTYLEEGYRGGVHIDTGTNILYTPGGPSIPGWSTSPWNSDVFFEWTHVGTDGLIKVKIDPDDKIEETNKGNNVKFADPITVADAPQFRIWFVPVAFPGEEDWTISASSARDQIDFLISTYPIAEYDVYSSFGPCWRFSSDPGGIISDIDWLYGVVAYPIACTARIMGYDRVVIVLKKPFGGTGVAIGVNKRPPILEPVVLSSTFPDVDNVAHEIGHTFNLWHPQDIGPPVFETERYEVKEKEYGDSVDTFMSYRSDPTWIAKERYDSIPYTVNPPGWWYFPGDSELEIEPRDSKLIEFVHWNLVDQLTVDPPTYTCIMVTGTLGNDGTITSDNNWYRIQATPDVPNQKNSGNDNYRIVLLNNYHQAIAVYPFSASVHYMQHIDETGYPEITQANSMPILLNVPEIDGTRYIQIQTINGQTFVEREISINDPIVTITHPNGGEQFKAGDTITIEWNGVDQDQNTLGYTIGYSNDNGNNWVPLAFDIKETIFEWNTQDIETGEYLVKVIASDGVNTGEDISDGTFQLPKNKQIEKTSEFTILRTLLRTILHQFSSHFLKI